MGGAVANRGFTGGITNNPYPYRPYTGTATGQVNGRWADPSGGSPSITKPEFTVDPYGTAYQYINPTSGGPGSWQPYAPPEWATGGSGTSVKTGTSGSASGNGLTKDDILAIINSLKTSGQQPNVPSPNAPPRIAAPNAPQLDQGAYFAQAKDATGRVANQALAALRDEMTSRGVQGSGVEGKLSADILKGAAQTQSEAMFDAAQKQWAMDWDAAKAGYEGSINQRANDIGLSGVGYGGQVAQRGQNVDYQNRFLSLIPSVLNLLGR